MSRRCSKEEGKGQFARAMETGVSPSRVSVLSCAHYFQSPARQATRILPPSAMLCSSLLLLITDCKLIFNLHRNASELLEEREHIYLSEQAN